MSPLKKRLFLMAMVCFALLFLPLCTSSEDKTSKQKEKTSVAEKSEETGISEAEVADFMSGIESATHAEDAESLREYFSPSAKITLTRGVKTMVLDVDSYLKGLQEEWNKESFSVPPTNESEVITLDPDGRGAVVETDVRELITAGDKEIEVTSHQITRLKLIDGALLVTSVEAVVK